MHETALMDGVLSIVLLRIEDLVSYVRQSYIHYATSGKTYLPARCREYMFVSLIVASFDNLAGMRFILFLRCVCKQAHVVVNIKIEQRTRLSARFIDYEIVECIML